MTAEEQGKIVSAAISTTELLRSYLPTHSVFYNSLRRDLCDFAEAIRARYAEAKIMVGLSLQKRLEAIRARYAEAKLRIMMHSPCRRGKQSARGTLRQSSIIGITPLPKMPKQSARGTLRQSAPSMLFHCIANEAIRARYAEAKFSSTPLKARLTREAIRARYPIFA